MKKIMSIVLVFALVFGLTTNAFALENMSTSNFNENTISDSNQLEKNVNSIVNSFAAEKQAEVKSGIYEASTLLPLGNLVSVEEKNGKLWYNYQLEGGLESSICIENCDNGRKYIVTEGDLTNEIILDQNGNIMLDGKYVTFSEENLTSEIAMPIGDNLISPTGITSDYQYFDACPYGSASDYNKLVISSNVADAELERDLQSITVAALNYIIYKWVFKIDYLAVLDKYSNEISLLISAITTFSRNSIDTYPTNSSMSYKKWRYVHGTDGYYIDSLRYSVEKHVLNLYPQRNYQGDMTRVTVYERFLPNI